MVDNTLRYGTTINQASGVGLRPRPNDPFSTAAATGLGGLSASQADALIQKMPTSIGDFDYACSRNKKNLLLLQNDIAYDRISGKMSVNGFSFDVDDYSDALRSVEYLGSRPSARPAGTWSTLTSDEYEDYIRRIANPDLKDRFAKGFSMGVQGLKTLTGAGLQFAGAEETGSRMVSAAQERLEELSPYQATFAQVTAGELSAIEYAVSMLGQQGPNIIESIAAGLIGFAVGGAASGNPLGAALGGFGGVMTKAGFKKAAIEAAEVYAKKGLKGLDAKQRKALAQLGGVGAAIAINNYVIGTADVYGEMRDRGAEAGDDRARAAAAALGIPYAILSTIPRSYRC